jgi:hypothetical protein
VAHGTINFPSDGVGLPVQQRFTNTIAPDDGNTRAA